MICCSRMVKDAALLLCVVGGHDSRDPLSLRDESPHFTAALGGVLPAYRIGFAASLWERPVDSRIQQAVREAASLFESLGCRVEEVHPED